jgi:hypothetical protein
MAESAEGARLLSECRVKSLTEGSNPSLSAILKSPTAWLGFLYLVGRSLLKNDGNQLACKMRRPHASTMFELVQLLLGRQKFLSGDAQAFGQYFGKAPKDDVPKHIPILVGQPIDRGNIYF